MDTKYLTMNIDEFEELPFSFEGDLSGQCDPIPFFMRAFRHFITEGEEVLVIHPKDEMRKAMIHALERLGAKVYDAEPTDSYNYMLDVIHMRSERRNDIDLICGSSEGLRGLLKHSAEIRTGKILVSDRYVPPVLISDLKQAWDCKVFTHYTRPELGGLGAISCEAGDGMHISTDIYIEIIDPETGVNQPDGKWGEVVITSLFPAKYPMVRYRTGDISRYYKEACPCGLGTPKIDQIKNQNPGVF